MRFTPSGSIVSASQDGTVARWERDGDRLLWSVSFKRPPRTYDYTRIQITAMDLSADGRLVVLSYLRSGVDRNLVDEKAGDPMKQKDGVWEPHVVLLDAVDGSIKRDIHEDRDTMVWDVLFFSTGKSILSTKIIPLPWAPRDRQSPISTLRVLSVETGNEVQSFTSEDWFGKAALSPDGKLLAVTTFRYMESVHKLLVYDLEAGRLLHSSPLQTTGASALAFSPDGRLLAVARLKGPEIYLDLISPGSAGMPPRTIRLGEATTIRSLAFIPNQRRIALAGGRLPFVGTDDVGTPLFKDQGGVVIAADESTGKRLKRYKLKSYVNSLAISQDGSIMAAGMYNGQIAITHLGQ